MVLETDTSLISKSNFLLAGFSIIIYFKCSNDYDSGEFELTDFRFWSSKVSNEALMDVGT